MIIPNKNEWMYIVLGVIFGLIFLIGLTSCETIPNSQRNITNYKNHVKARMTMYHRHEDKFGNHVAIGGRAREGWTVAARRKLMVLGQFGFIPQLKGLIGNGIIRCEDRGRAVEKLKASRGKYEVIDVYLECANRRIARQRIRYYEHVIGPYVDLYF